MKHSLKVSVSPPQSDRAIQRVADALAKYKPAHVQITDEASADLVVLHVIGRQDQVTKKAKGLKKYAVIQYAVRSTLRPSTKGWLPLWQGAEAVWSYYDLKALCEQDKQEADFSFYHAPLGVDKVFRPSKRKKKYIMMTNSHSYLTESVREVILAAQRVNRSVFHLGSELHRPHVVCKSGISDEELAEMYSECEFVSGLRRVEGFELPVVEGLMCGARPVCFDRPHYRQWFDGLAEFIPETPRNEVIDSLEKLFRSGAKPVTAIQRLEVAQRFSWEQLVAGFWKRI